MRSLKIIIPAILVFLLIVGGIYTIYQSQIAPKIDLGITTVPSPPKNNFPESSASAKPQTKNNTSVTNQPSTGPDDELAIQNIGIHVNNLNQDQKITSPLIVKGVANVTSQTITIKVYDKTGNTLGQGKASACVSLTGCNFEASVVFQKSPMQTGYIEIYSPSTLDGKQLYLQTFSVNF